MKPGANVDVNRKCPPAEIRYRPSASAPTKLYSRGQESVARHFGVDVGHYFRRGFAPDAPLVVFLPGAAHVGRIAYGHNGARPEDFLDFWLAKDGYGLLALSYPGHASVAWKSDSNLLLDHWIKAVAKTIGEKVAVTGANKIIVAAWSMSVRWAGLLSRQLANVDVHIAAFIPLAGSPPMPGLSSIDADSEILTPDGFWDASSSTVGGIPRLSTWLEELAMLSSNQSSVVLAPDDYRQYYLTLTPVTLACHEKLASRLKLSLPEFNLAHFPLAYPISPSGFRDCDQAARDAANWDVVNTQILRGYLAGADQLDEARLLLSSCQTIVPGGHLFFVGENGARATATAIDVLWRRLPELARQLMRILSVSPTPDAERSLFVFGDIGDSNGFRSGSVCCDGSRPGGTAAIQTKRGLSHA